MGLQVNSCIWGAFFQSSSLVSAINCVVRFSILSERIHLNHLNLHAPNNVQMLKSYSLFFSYAILIQSWVSPLVIPHNRTNESLGTSLLTVFSVKGSRFIWTPVQLPESCIFQWRRKRMLYHSTLAWVCGEIRSKPSAKPISLDT